MFDEYLLFVELCYRTRTKTLTAADTLTLLQYPHWIDQIHPWNSRYLFEQPIQNPPIITPSDNYLLNNIVKGN